MPAGTKCPVSVNGATCGREHIKTRKKPLGRKRGSNFSFVHYECEIHKFHVRFPGQQWVHCDCEEREKERQLKDLAASLKARNHSLVSSLLRRLSSSKPRKTA
jgi:hypothetical protein